MTTTTVELPAPAAMPEWVAGWRQRRREARVAAVLATPPAPPRLTPPAGEPALPCASLTRGGPLFYPDGSSTCGGLGFDYRRVPVSDDQRCRGLLAFHTACSRRVGVWQSRYGLQSHGDDLRRWLDSRGLTGAPAETVLQRLAEQQSYHTRSIAYYQQQLQVAIGRQ